MGAPHNEGEIMRIHGRKQLADRDVIVTSSAARMPAKCWGVYRRLAVMEVVPGTTPAAIDARCKGVLRIVETHERLSSRGGAGTAFACALREALADLETLSTRE
jgi:hypothetical protein